jgi:hypothetical protein
MQTPKCDQGEQCPDRLIYSKQSNFLFKLFGSDASASRLPHPTCDARRMSSETKKT